MDSFDAYFGRGLYTTVEAAKLTRMRPSRVRRWVKGYAFVRDDGERYSPPMWTPDIQPIEGTVALSFLDIVELMVVRQFLEHGVSIHAIRRAIEFAKTEYQLAYPFASKRFRTDGQSVFLSYGKGEGRDADFRLLNIPTRQFALEKIINQSLRDVDYDDHIAIRWRPLPGSDNIIVDPKRSFGQPIANKSGVPTSALVAAVASESPTGKFRFTMKALPGA